MHEPLPSTYDPRGVEADIYRRWLEGGYFHARPESDRPPYVIVIPPPNVTGALHGGHALNNTLQDILIRWHRMRGYDTLWMPGTDHAGIATQAVVERTILEKERKTRHDLGRDELVRRIWAWKETYGNRIIEQLKLMGCSCDWERTRFTLDEICARAVRQTFFNLFRDGLIVRGKRLVNWDTHLQTAVADDEVYHEQVKGHFYHFKYPVIDPQPGEPAFVHIATTRPETMLGDTAVAVHPEPDKALDEAEAELRQQLEEVPEKDRPALQAQLEEMAERRRNLLPLLLRLRDMARAGRQVLLPLVDRPIPLITDIWARPELGSGCVKITPAHDANDYEVYRRHPQIGIINVLTPDGRIASLASHSRNPALTATLEGLKFATEGRRAVVAAMEQRGLVEKIEDRLIDIGHSDRSKTPIEPFLSDQWFVRMGDLPAAEAARIPGLRGSTGLAQLAMDAVCRQKHTTAEQRKACGRVHIFPERYARTYLDWLSEKRDWCISRQLWWGHRIPVWSRTFQLTEKNWPEELLRPGMDSLLEGHWAKIAPLAVRVVREDTGEPVGDARRALFPVTAATEGTYRFYVCLQEDSPELEDLLRQAGFEQDPDVLDTWFSSALWPHSTLGWPEQTPELNKYYPGDVLSTAREIITLWVARMVLTGLYNIGRVPFHDVYIHAVIQDGQGRPFKKTLGNGFDPVDIIEVYGADALRFTLAGMTTETQDIRMPMKRIRLDDGRELQTSERFELGRNFCNKVWNAARFAFLTLGEGGSADDGGLSPGDGPSETTVYTSSKSYMERTRGAALDRRALPIEDRWILSRVSAAAVEVQDALSRFQFSRATTAARDFFWDALCDWYLEMVKSRVRESRQADEARAVLAFTLDQALRLLHPFIPFITERIWQQFNRIWPDRSLPGLVELDAGRDLIVSAYPPPEGWPRLVDPRAEQIFADLQTATRAVRDIRQNCNVPPRRQVDVTIRVPGERVASLQEEARVIRHLAQVGELVVAPDAPKPPNAATLVIGDMQIFVAEVIDPAAERARLEKELAGLDRQMQALTAKLANQGFVSRAPAEVIRAERERLADLQARAETIRRGLQELPTA